MTLLNLCKLKDSVLVFTSREGERVKCYFPCPSIAYSSIPALFAFETKPGRQMDLAI